MLEIADRVTVLRRGKKIGTVDTAGATEASLAKLMVGRDVLFRLEKEASARRRARCSRSRTSRSLDDRGLPALRGLSLEVRAGEIVGLAGVDGNGQSELVEAIAGLREPRAGPDPRGRAATSPATGVRGALAAGVGHIAEDRHRRGLILDFSLAENLALRDYKRAPLAASGCSRPRKMERARPAAARGVRRPRRPARRAASSLSGGNQQKVVIAREIDEEPKVLLAAQPTRGLDVGAIEFVHRRLLEQRAAGRGVLLVSLELEEIRVAGRPRARHLRRAGSSPSSRRTRATRSSGVAMTRRRPRRRDRPAA